MVAVLTVEFVGGSRERWLLSSTEFDMLGVDDTDWRGHDFSAVRASRGWIT